MTRHTEPLSGNLENPLDFIAEDHMLKRQVCALIDRLAANLPVARAERRMMLAFLTEQWPQHLADEELDLFPLMLQRCGPDEKINSLIDKLKSDHVQALAAAPAIAALIAASEPGHAVFADSACTQMTEFANHARRHLILENAIILPLARARLTKQDLAIMKSHMLKRREHVARARSPARP